jgi:hypothetical protein
VASVCHQRHLCRGLTSRLTRTRLGGPAARPSSRRLAWFVRRRVNPIDLRAALPRILPLAVEWATSTSAEGAASGTSLGPPGVALAKRVGVVRPEQIRVVAVDQLPQPAHLLLRQAASQVRLLDGMGLTLGHTIFLCRRDSRIDLLAHECRHVAQYEKAGSIAAFLAVYLEQVVTVGYENAPFEIDARAHEIHGA